MRVAHLASLTAISAVANASPATRKHVRETNTTAVTLTAHFEQWNTDGGGAAQFSVSAPADYVPGAPEFDVTCYTGFASNGECQWNSDKPSEWGDYTTVSASFDSSSLNVTLTTQFVTSQRLRTTRTATGHIDAAGLNDPPNSYDFPLVFSDDVETIPGVLGNYGKWSAVNATQPSLDISQAYQPWLNYSLSTSDGYAPGAPGFNVECSYDITQNQGASVYQTCTPLGDNAADSTVTALAYYMADSDCSVKVRHTWTAANGSKYEVDGDGEVFFFQGNSFNIEPHVLLSI
ncbi:hypothetical protein F5Y18DRAFT_360065 [Xylariaceae sp. FL1019]|nr:hypothetical protein F5Y18DRAFT_360065 [Xylariaceae sp. FL1019]